MIKKLRKLKIGKGKINIMSSNKKKKKLRLNFNSTTKNCRMFDLNLPNFGGKKRKKLRRLTET